MNTEQEETTWLEAEILEIGQTGDVHDTAEKKAAIISLTFDDPQMIGASYVHRLESREQVEVVIRALRQAANALWPMH